MGAPLTQPPPPQKESAWSTLQKTVSAVAGIVGSVAAILGALVAIGVLGGGGDEDGGSAEPSLASVPVSFQAESADKWTRFTELEARSVPPGTLIELSCDGGGCGFDSLEHYVREATANVPLTDLVPYRFRPGDILEVRLTKPDHVGKLIRYPIRRRAVPDSAVYCLPPGRAPVPC
jgi:hypothetical protein